MKSLRDKTFYHSLLQVAAVLVVGIPTCLLIFSPVQAQTAVLKEKATVIYELPSVKSRKIAALAAGDTVRLVQSKGAWLQLVFHKNRQGWMRLVSTPQDRKSAPEMPSRDRAVAAEKEIAPEPPAATPVASPRTSTSDLSRRLVPENAVAGLSFHLGFFSKDFSYVGKFYYQSLPSYYLEGSFQYVAGQLASLYLMDGNIRRVWPLPKRAEWWLSGGVGVITSVPIKSAGSKSISNMEFNYGTGIRKHLRENTWLRIDLRLFNVLIDGGLATFFEATTGLAFSINQPIKGN